MTRVLFAVLMAAVPLLAAAQNKELDVKERVDAIISDVRAGKHIERKRYSDIEDALIPRIFDFVSDPGLKPDADENYMRNACDIVFDSPKNNPENALKLFDLLESRKLPVSPAILVPLEKHATDPRVHAVALKIASDPSKGDCLRGDAVDILVKIPDAATETALVDILKTPYSYKIGYLVVHTLRQIWLFTSDAAEKACILYLGHQDEYSAKAAYDSLIKILRAKPPKHAADYICAENAELRKAAIDSLAGGPDPVASLKYMKAALKLPCTSASRRIIRDAIALCRSNARATMLRTKFNKSGLNAELETLAETAAPLIMAQPDESKINGVLAPFDKIQEKYGDDVYMCLLLAASNTEDKNTWGRMALLSLVMQRRHPPYSLLKEVFASKAFPTDSRRIAMGMFPVAAGLNRPEAINMLEKFLKSKDTDGFERGEIKMTLNQLRPGKASKVQKDAAGR